MPIQKHANTVKLVHPSERAWAEVHYKGATVIHWNVEGEEKLFLSKVAVLDAENKAIRGGIPIVFPVFGKTDDPEYAHLPPHGVARTEKWELIGEVMDREEGVSVKFGLDATTSPHLPILMRTPFKLQYVVTLTARELTTRLVVHAPTSSPAPLRFQALLHNYFSLPSASDATITGLTGCMFIDKTRGGVKGVEDRTVVRVADKSSGHNEVDRIYDGPPHKPGRETSDIKLSWSDSNGIFIRKWSSAFPQVVVWNPSPEKAKAMADLEEGGEDRFVCIEPGHVLGWVELKQGQSWIGQQVLLAF